MSAGELREELRFERRATTPDDGYGNVEGHWEELYCCRARVRPDRGGEEVLARRLSGVTSYRIRIRSCRDARMIGTDCRAVDTRSGAVFNLTSIINADERDRYLDITATQGVAHG